MTFKPIRTEAKNNGTQSLYRFDNGYGASVIQNAYSYGAADGLWELAVIVWRGEDFYLTYETPITSDVLGHLGEGDVPPLLQQIADLPSRTEAS